MFLIALAGGLLTAAAPRDMLIPPTRVTTSFTCHGIARTITIARRTGQDALVGLTANSKPAQGKVMAAIRSGLGPVTAIDEITPYCGDGPDRIRIKGRTDGKKRDLMIFFGPAGQVAVRDVG